MGLVSPRSLLQNARALADRPFRHRRYEELARVYRAPDGAWWSGDERWYPVDYPPREGNHLTPLVDGQEAMRAMYDAMEHACESIYLTAWFLTPELRMIRPTNDTAEPRTGKGGPHAFLSLIARKAGDVDVRILLWPGTYLGKFSRRQVKAARQALLNAHPKVRAVADTHEKFAHCHHQKSLVIDGRVAFVGGLDVTAFDADRWDVQEHLFRQGPNWHDVHWRIEGPCVADVASNFVERWNASSPRALASVPAAPEPFDDGVVAQVQRTIPQGIYAFAPRGIHGIAHAYVHAIARAERFIYLESQYLWSPEISDALNAAIHRGRDSGLRVAIVLPAHPNVGKGDTDRHVERLLETDEGRGVFSAYTLYTSCRDDQGGAYRYRPIYVHAKVAIVDDAWATAGSANLNGRGMATDSEINLSTTDAAVARALRLRLWSEHLGCAEDELRGVDPAAVLEGRWRAAAVEQRRIVKSRAGLLTAAIYPYPLGRIDADFGPGEIESLLLDR